MSIYDKFMADTEWKETNERYHCHGLSYDERKALQAKLCVIEDRIRKDDAKEWEEIKRKHQEENNG